MADSRSSTTNDSMYFLFLSFSIGLVTCQQQVQLPINQTPNQFGTQSTSQLQQQPAYSSSTLQQQQFPTAGQFPPQQQQLQGSQQSGAFPPQNGLFSQQQQQQQQQQQSPGNTQPQTNPCGQQQATSQSNNLNNFASYSSSGSSNYPNSAFSGGGVVGFFDPSAVGTGRAPGVSNLFVPGLQASQINGGGSGGSVSSPIVASPVGVGQAAVIGFIYVEFDGDFVAGDAESTGGTAGAATGGVFVLLYDTTATVGVFVLLYDTAATGGVSGGWYEQYWTVAHAATGGVAVLLPATTVDVPGVLAILPKPAAAVLWDDRTAVSILRDPRAKRCRCLWLDGWGSHDFLIKCSTEVLPKYSSWETRVFANLPSTFFHYIFH